MLRKIRVFAAILVGLLFIAIFIDFRGLLPDGLVNFVSKTQFLPSILRTARMGLLASLALVLLVALTLLTGRTYCSFLCPLGIMQDFFSRMGKKLKLSVKLKYRKPLNVLRYILLALATVVFIGGSAFLLNLLDPYSIFGRVFSYLVQPVVILANNGLAIVLNHLDIYSVYQVKQTWVHWPILIWTLGFLVFVAVLSIRRGRLYCNTVCPVGTLLGLISRFSIFKVRLADSCTSCGKCAKVCKSECIDPKSRQVDSTRCVACFNCLDVCKFDAISFGAGSAKLEKTRVKAVDRSRRDLFRKTLTSSALMTAAYARVKADPVKSNRGLTPLNREHHASPPGSESHQHFNATCTGCSLCVTACPNNVLQPALWEYGFSGMMQPFMDFNSGLCNYECTLCGEVCPTGAIFQLTVEQKKKTQIGVAHFIKNNCVVETHGTDCGACSEHCPTKAVNMVPHGRLMIPEVDDAICVGCGACEYACPVAPFKAIYVDGHVQHQEAKSPQNKKAAIEIEDDFPF
jgi:ferredoxin-type protein NapF